MPPSAKKSSVIITVILSLLGFINTILAADNTSDIERVFDYAEESYSHFFAPANQSSFTLDNYRVRYYPNTDTYVGYNPGNASIYVYGAVFGGLKKVATLSDILVQIPQPILTTSSTGYLKLDHQGNVISDDATSWSCVKDTSTNLIWEVKTIDGGLRDMNHTYSWYNSTGDNDGGSAGYPNYDKSCFDTINCDTEKYTQQVNGQWLCGANDWRMPSLTELASLDISGSSYPSVNIAYFPNMPSQTDLDYWSGSPSEQSSNAWFISFNYGNSFYSHKGFSKHVRLVRTGQ